MQSEIIAQGLYYNDVRTAKEENDNDDPIWRGEEIFEIDGSDEEFVRFREFKIFKIEKFEIVFYFPNLLIAGCGLLETRCQILTYQNLE